MSNQDKVVDYILENTETLSAPKIKALSGVLSALGGEKLDEPNEVEDVKDPNLIDETQPLDLSQIKGMVIDGNKTPVKIYNN